MRNTITSQVKDAVSTKLKDDRIKIIDANTENAAILAMLGDLPWPRNWQTRDFNPTADVRDALDLLTYMWPTKKWGMRFEGLDFSAWIEDDTYTVYSFSAPRTIFLSMWTYWRINHDGENE